MEVNQFIQDQKLELSNELRIFKNVSIQRLFQTNQVLNSTTKNLSLHARFKFNNERKVLDSSADQLKSHVRSKRNFENQRINQLQLNLMKHAKVNVSVGQNQLRDTQTYMMQQLPKFFIKTEQAILNLEKNVKLMDPTLLLKRGYSLSLFQGKVINAKNPVKSGDIIETVTFENRITSEIKDIKKEENE
jgi:exodeoxyribonuclease VII large subunit